MDTNYSFLISAINFAADKHRHQKRKNPEKTPYINHPLKVCQYLSESGIDDTDTLVAAVLHDTVEDTDATLEQIDDIFGSRVASIVAEVTDNKSLPKAERKRLQITHAKEISDEAKCVKMADKLHNLSSFLEAAPVGWDYTRIQGYFVWSRAVVNNCRGVNNYLEDKLDRLFLTGKFTLNRKEYDCLPKNVDLDEYLNLYLLAMESTKD
jgi:guanosine-3',5'-bis(diphosphate) 3'-pyrophosphohydrolase